MMAVHGLRAVDSVRGSRRQVGTGKFVLGQNETQASLPCDTSQIAADSARTRGSLG